MTNKKKRSHLEKVMKWMAETSNHQPNGISAAAVDPLAWLNSQDPTCIDGSSFVTQRCLDLHKAKYNDLDKAQRTVFGITIIQLRARLADKLNVTANDVNESQWHTQLTRAMKSGQPADFSWNNTHKQCNIKVYAVEKLQPRCRQLHNLIFHDNSSCAKVRSKLLPTLNTNTTKCISLGGGPGFDHVSFCIAAQFLYDIQPHRNELLPKRIKTEVYDLYNHDWKPVMQSLGECFDDEKHLTMHHVDLRLDLANEAHEQLRSSLPSVDIICVQYVLHENASYLINDQNQIIGVMKDVFVTAPVGTVMIITDSSNKLFRCLKDAAKENGWRYLCAEEQLMHEGKRRAYLGPKSFLVLERLKCIGT
eukprot:scaffold36302_cov34-Cyclotella_meneghiniana.AAC.2